MKLKWSIPIPIVLFVFFATGCGDSQKTKHDLEQQKITGKNQSELTSDQTNKPAVKPEKPSAQPEKPTIKPGNTTNQQETSTHQTIKIHDESIQKERPIINIIYPQIDGMKDKLAQAEINDTLKKKANNADESQMSNDDPSSPSSFFSKYEITFQNDHLISFMFNQYYYLSGAAHGMPSRVPILVDLDNGKIVEPNEMYNESDKAKQIITQLVLKEDVLHTLEAMGEFKQITSDDLNQIYLTKEGLIIYFPPYEYASYAEGTLQYQLPFSDIKGILNTAFFNSHGIDISKPSSLITIYVSEGYHFSVPKTWIDRLVFERADYEANKSWYDEVNIYYNSSDKPILFSIHMYEKQVWTSLKPETEVELVENNNIIYSYSVRKYPQNDLQVNDFLNNVVPEIMKTFQIDF
ncbi:DUF3298 and DUF4163 domain-containing protein [Paenibacillus sp. BSR1-1]|uniref:DUF3298 and DUF4163 domain-containing protein n=1 Tax=Paenibacillus sp. BSR1-1 TaxID=3020845 RepID=UPI0025B0C7E1|nr:DUF3298 and DUF4163 domain-containing protein [Paenibacillus sp. BSR1-1]MDN3016919.1 DUF3298 and DUF4163 domain-containing protein [Paenibacillus sp. BSR1-1]